MNVIDRFFKAIPNLPMMPKVVTHVIQLLGQDDINLQQVIKEVAHDVVISAKVLRLANSSYYGVSRNIKTIDDAVSLIGVNSLRTLVVASGITGAFSNTGMDLTRFWGCSLLTANVARLIARKVNQEPETAYLSGLMHGVGQLLIHANLPQAMHKLDMNCTANNVLERVALEKAELGVNHCQIGSELARRWNFPPEIQKAIHYYENPLNALAGDYALIVYASAHIAYSLNNHQELDVIVDTFPQAMMKGIGMDKPAFMALVECSQGLMEEANSFF